MSLEKQEIILAFEENPEKDLVNLLVEEFDDIERENLSSLMEEAIEDKGEGDLEEYKERKEEDDFVEAFDAMISSMKYLKLEESEVVVSSFAIKISGGDIERTSEDIKKVLEREGIDFEETARYAREFDDLNELMSLLKDSSDEFQAHFPVETDSGTLEVSLSQDKIKVTGEQEQLNGEYNE